MGYSINSKINRFSSLKNGTLNSDRRIATAQSLKQGLGCCCIPNVSRGDFSIHQG